MKVAVITPAIADPKRLFGAERHFLGMAEAFRRRVDADWIQVPISEVRWESLLQGYLDCFDLDLSQYDVVISTKVPTFLVQHRNHICWLLHQVRVFYDRFDDEYGDLPEAALIEKRRQREAIHVLDGMAFRGIRKIFTNGHETARRLRHYNGFDAEVLYPPVLAQGHYRGSLEYFLLPGRLHPWKRVDLAIRAMQHVPGDIPLLIAGSGPDEDRLRSRAAGNPRIQFLGFVGDAQMLDLYADALAVLFLPKDEDFGYITVEAMLSHKPVIICRDSGEPTLLVRNDHSGFVVQPEPASVARAMSIFASNPQLARDMGEFASRSAPSQSWDEVVDRLLQAAAEPAKIAPAPCAEKKPLPSMTQIARDPVRVLVACNQVLEPAIGGGRVRVKNICKGLAAHFPTEYLGAYDWAGPPPTDDWPLPTWHCRVLTFTSLHYKLAARLQRHVPGGSVIDVALPWMARLSPQFLAEVRRSVAAADVVVFAQPWIYLLARDLLDGKLVVYDSQNFEYGLRERLLSSTWIGRRLADGVKYAEGELARRSEVIWVCSWEDADAMAQAYGLPRERFELVPNCADVWSLMPADEDQKASAKSAFGWQGRAVAVFVASGYRPNTEAATFIIHELAPKFPQGIFAIAGTVKEDYLRTHVDPASRFPNVQLLGVLSDQQLRSMLQAADVALNPVEIGSGTNLKLVQSMAAGLPIVSTKAGVRGIERGPEICLVAERAQFAEKLQRLLDDAPLRDRLGRLARQEAEQNYDWSSALDRAAQGLNRRLHYRRRMTPPFFSVVIPTFNRRDHVLRALDALTRQTFPDFDVVVVDQSDPPIDIPARYKNKLTIRYVYSEERGPALARNKGIREASGHIVAFTDDDCIPEPDWLEKAARHFDQRPIAGLEGRIRSEKIGDPNYRTVSNLNFEGIGFMTANMFYRRDLLGRVDGFDERFHDFREDTDLAWRIMEFGEIPHARDVVVFHPPHPATVERESQAERAKMFRVDPLLLERHPDKYIKLLRSEGHYRHTPGFWRHFVRGLQSANVRPPVAKLLQELRAQDPEWWAAVDTGNGMLQPEDLEAVRSLLTAERVEVERL
ncbi:MAG: glycosyltransferase [Candidatus Korobacteraceae bacterium]